jgi:hypothetical protein
MPQAVTRVCLFRWPHVARVGRYEIASPDPVPYFAGAAYWETSELLWNGWNAYSRPRSLLSAEGIDRLYRERDPAYMRFIADFVDRYRDYDLIVMATYNCVHPEVLWHELKKPTKILGFIDDPYSTYGRGIPYLWAFDGAFHISPSYDDRDRLAQALARWGCPSSYFWPLVPFPFTRAEPTAAFFADRPTDLAYVGNVIGTKVDRLVELKARFGDRLRVHGRWGLRGWIGVARGLVGKPIFPHRVTPLSDDERTRLYHATKIGLNMHVSPMPHESGNARTYEVAAHGMMLLSDKGALDGHALIFKPGEEAVYYDSIAEAIDQAEYYLNHPTERIAIARAGFERYWRDYEFEGNLVRFLDWASSIPRRTPRPE